MIEFIDQYVDEKTPKSKFIKWKNKSSQHETKCSESSEDEMWESKKTKEPSIKKRRESLKQKSHSNVIYCLPKKTIRKLISIKCNGDILANSANFECNSPSNQVNFYNIPFL